MLEKVIKDGCECWCEIAPQIGGTIDKPFFSTAAEIGLIIFVILLVIIGLIIGFKKLKGQEDDDDEKYY